MIDRNSLVEAVSSLERIVPFLLSLFTGDNRDIAISFLNLEESEQRQMLAALEGAHGAYCNALRIVGPLAPPIDVVWPFDDEEESSSRGARRRAERQRQESHSFIPFASFFAGQEVEG